MNRFKSSQRKLSFVFALLLLGGILWNVFAATPHLMAEGYTSGIYTLEDGKRYVFDASGEKVEGWYEIDGFGKAYGASGTGEAYHGGIFEIDGQDYLFDDWGFLVQDNWNYDRPGEGWSYAKDDGTILKDGTYKVHDQEVFFDENGHSRARGWFIDEEGRHFVDESGQFVRSEVYETSPNHYHIFDDNGLLAYGWVYTKGGWAYGQTSNGEAAKGRQLIDGKYYVFTQKGLLGQGMVYDPDLDRWFVVRQGEKKPSMITYGDQLFNGMYWVDGEPRAVDYQGYYRARPFGGSNGSITYSGYYDFIYIDIAQQSMWVVRNGRVVIATPVVTGNPNRGWDTPYGSYSVQVMKPGTTLIGADYVLPVSYWIRFTNQEHGIHDSSWRSEYGGNLYLWDGTHGCANVPPNIMNQVYWNTYRGMPVFVR